MYALPVPGGQPCTLEQIAVLPVVTLLGQGTDTGRYSDVPPSGRSAHDSIAGLPRGIIPRRDRITPSATDDASPADNANASAAFRTLGERSVVATLVFALQDPLITFVARLPV